MRSEASFRPFFCEDHRDILGGCWPFGLHPDPAIKGSGFRAGQEYGKPDAGQAYGRSDAGAPKSGAAHPTRVTLVTLGEVHDIVAGAIVPVGAGRDQDVGVFILRPHRRGHVLVPDGGDEGAAWGAGHVAFGQRAA